MSLKDIEKLKEKVDKDSNSKLFVPLAEEYRKEGMLEEAVNALLSGLEKQPGYVSARVSLGKIYLEKGQLPEARGEFERVVKAIPDNLFAHKKLAELYRDSGEKDLAIKAFKIVLRLNPKDEDSLMQLKDLESLEAEQPQPEPVARPQPAVQELPPFTEEAFGEISLPETDGKPLLSEELPAAENTAEDDIAAFKDSVFGSKEEETVSADSGIPAEEAVELAEDAGQEEEGLSFGNFEAEMQAEPQAGPDFSEQLIVEEIKAHPFSQEMPSRETPAGQDDAATIEQAEQCIATGDFIGALTVYRKMLTANPDNKKALQRVEELKGLLKLMGKDKEALIVKLNAFLDTVYKRRDEFLRHS